MTLYESVERHRASRKTAIYFRGGRITFRTLLNRIDATAEILYEKGIRKDTMVSLLAPNVPETIIAFYALNKIGAVINVLHPLLPSKVLVESLKETKSSYLIILDVRYPDYSSDIASLNIPTFFLSPYPDLNPIIRCGFKVLYRKTLKGVDKTKYLYRMKTSGRPVPLCTDDAKASVFLRSGGTTGKSKTIMLNDQAIDYLGTQSTAIVGRPLAGLSMIGVLPLFHGFGLAMGVHAPLANEAATALMISYNGKEIIRKIAQNKINVMIAVPYMADKLLQNKAFRGKKLRNLVVTYIGADKPERRLFDAFDARMMEAGSQNRLLEGYGLTETVTVNFVNTNAACEIGSVGRPLKGVRVRIASPEDYGTDLGTDKEGEILIASPCLCLGYYNTPEAEQPFYTDSEHVRWLKTGDIGSVDANGFLFFKNRMKDVFKIAGYNVFPSDIEALADSVPGVKACAAICVSEDAHPYVNLFVEMDGGNVPEASEMTIRRFLEERLLKYSVPEKITILSALPRTNIGKIDRKDLQRRAETK